MDLTQLMQRQRMAQLRQQVLLNSLDIPVEQLPLVTQLTGAVQWLHQPPRAWARPSLPLEELWAMGLSGDRPLLAVFLNREESPLLPLALHFTALQRSLGMQVELAIAVLEEGGSLLDTAQQALDASPIRDLRGKGVGHHGQVHPDSSAVRLAASRRQPFPGRPAGHHPGAAG